MANYYSYFDDSAAGQNTRDQIDEESAIFGMGVSQDINCGIITATAGNFSGNVSVGGTLTYDDVKNVDSIGLITARSGIDVTGGQLTVGVAFSVGAAGVVTATSYYGDGSALTGVSGVGNTDYVVSIATTTGDLNVSGVATIGTGVTVYGNAGIVSATSFHGDGSSLSGLSGGFSNMVVLTSGTSWSVPAGIKKIKVFCTGAGGGGGYSNDTHKASGSGGAGGTTIHYFDTTAGGSATYAIGAAGAKSTSESSLGTTGGDSTFAYGGTTITGGGGQGGGGTSTSGAINQGGAGGTSSGGTLNLIGGSGGSGGFAAINGSTKVPLMLPGASYWGGTGRPGGYESSSNGATPANIGCGGIGGKNWNGTDGSAGLIVIEY